MVSILQLSGAKKKETPVIPNHNLDFQHTVPDTSVTPTTMELEKKNIQMATVIIKDVSY